jgi:hypothetical protein
MISAGEQLLDNLAKMGAISNRRRAAVVVTRANVARADPPRLFSNSASPTIF